MAATALQRRKIEMLLDKVDSLPTLPGVAHRVLPLAIADHANFRRLQQAIESDAALAARAVALAVRLGQPRHAVTSVEAALRGLPMDELLADLLTVQIVDPETLRRGRLAALWLHNLATAMAAQVIASRVGSVPPQQAHLAGLLHDIGRIALPLLMPRAFSQVLERVEAGGRDALEIEREILGVDHVVVGKRLAQRWGLPEALENVIWLHHQSTAALPVDESSAQLARMVHLADLIARQEGYSCHPSERLREDPTEVAEQLGLSGTHAQQIGHQVATALRANAEPIGIGDVPTPGQLWQLVARANVRLGQHYRAISARRRALDAQMRRADVLVKLNSRLAACRAPREVLETTAETAAEALGLRLVVPYLLAPDFEYVEGVLSTASGGVEEHFLYEISKGETIETLLADAPAPIRTGAAPTRAERSEAWLFERLGPRLGDGPFYTVPMLVEGAKVGGIVFALEDASRQLGSQETAELSALASMAGVALKRAQAESNLVALSEELAEVNRELEVAQDERLRQRNVAGLSEMAAGAAHEINNPLAIISGRAQQLAPGEADPERRQALESIIQQAQRISDILAELHRFARPPAPKPQTVDPVALAHEAAAALQDQARAASVNLAVQAPPKVPPVCVDPGQVGDAIQELIRNAIEACDKGKNVTVVIQPVPAEQTVRIIVADEGVGMEPQDRARAFDPFFSGRPAGRHRGLGLPKAFRAIEANGGQMALESKPGQGTTVRVTLPAVPETEEGGRERGEERR